MDLKGLLSSKLAIGVLVVLVLGGAVAGGFALGILGAPSIERIDNSFGQVNETTTEIETELVVNNPNPIGGSLDNVTIEYTVTMNGIEMARGDREGVTVEKGNTTIRFVTHMNNERIPGWWVSHIGEGEYTQLDVNAIIHTGVFGQSIQAPEVSRDVETDIMSGFNSSETRPLEANQEPVIQDPVLYLNSTSGTWGEVNENRTEIQMEFVLYNPKSYPISVSEIGYDIRMNNISIGSGQTSQAYTLPPGETTTVEATTVIQTQKLDEWWVSHLQRNQVTELEIDFYMQFDLTSGGGGSIRIPFDTLTQTIETDFFGNKPADGSTGDGTGDSETSEEGTTTPTDGATETSTPSGDATETPTSTDDSATETPTEATETPTSTPTDGGSTETSTPTDDGGLL